MVATYAASTERTAAMGGEAGAGGANKGRWGVHGKRSSPVSAAGRRTVSALCAKSSRYRCPAAVPLRACPNNIYLIVENAWRLQPSRGKRDTAAGSMLESSDCVERQGGGNVVETRRECGDNQ